MTTLCKLRAIYSALWHTKELIEQLDAHGNCAQGFDMPDLREMFYDLNDMCIRLTELRKAIEEEVAQ